MTDWKPRDFEIPLDFLGKGRFTAEIYGDAPDADAQPKHLLIETKRVASRSHLKLRLAPGGGCAVRFVAGDSR
jgi:alpha-glucosidase